MSIARTSLVTLLISFLTVLVVSPACAGSGRTDPDGPAAPKLGPFICSPAQGAAGTYVMLTGVGLGSATAVRFNGVAATSFVVRSTTQIEAVVPAGTRGGSIEISTTAGLIKGGSFELTDDLVVRAAAGIPPGTYATLIVAPNGDATLTGDVVVTGEVRILGGGQLCTAGHRFTGAPALEPGALFLSEPAAALAPAAQPETVLTAGTGVAGR